MNLASLYASLGPAGVVIVAVGCAGLYLALRNMFYLYFVWRDFKRDFLDIEHQEGRCLRDVCERSDNPLIAIVRDVVKTHGGHSEDIRAEVAYLFHRNFEGVTKGLCWLRLIAVVSPLLGLLGTILGMVTVFRTIAEHSAPDAAQLAAGMEAVSLSVNDETGVAGQVQPFDEVRVVCVTEAAGGAVSLDELCASSRVMSVGGDGAGEGAAYSAITLELTPEQADAVRCAQASGTISVQLVAGGMLSGGMVEHDG